MCFLGAECIEASLDRINWYIVEVEFLSIFGDGEVQDKVVRATLDRDCVVCLCSLFFTLGRLEGT
jgi:hypothetical protein